MKNKLYILLMLAFPFLSSSQILWDNFEDTRIGYYDFVHGGMTTRLDNPLPNAINSSELCAQYVRNPGETYDVIVIVANGPFLELTDYINGTKKMTVDVFSPAPGIPLQITLEDSSIAGGSPYPDGRHSIYTAITTTANEWERIEFIYDSRPDNSVSDIDVTSLILLFDIGNNTNDTYYFDNLYGPEFDNQCDGLVIDPTVNFADWDCNWDLRFCPSNSACSSYDYMSGWLNHKYNPDNTGINTSKYCGEYTRNPDSNGEDVLVSYFASGNLDLSVNKYFNFKIYGPPRPIYMSFQDAGGNEVFGYSSALLSNNEWQQFSIDLSTVSTASIVRFVLFLDQSVVNWDKYYLDDFNLSSMQLSLQELENADALKIYPQPADNHLNITLEFKEDDKKHLALCDVQGRVLLSRTLDQNFHNVVLDVSDLNSGIYFLKIKSRNSLSTKQVQIIK